MTNFRIDFSHPWLLLLLIPAIALTLLPYLRIPKKYRRTRNRVVSVVLHMIVMVLSITMLAGIIFKYEVPNKENELLLLVDSSYSNEETRDDKDDFISKIIDKCGSDYKVGVVKFGYDQVYAAELSNDSKAVYQEFIVSPDPDTTATDVESALRYASTLFTKPKTSKIVLITDGIETDGEAQDVIKEIAATGITVDTMYYPNESHMEVQVVGVELPATAEVGKNFKMDLMLESNFSGGEQTVDVTLYDNDEEKGTVTIPLDSEEQVTELNYQFEVPGMHKLRFEIANAEDTVKENNSYHTYMYLHVFENVLIIEKDEGESAELQTILTDGEYKVTSMSIQSDLETIPSTLTELCAYEQVILVNIANSDMPEGFDELLNDYVYNLGGGLFTVGGNPDTNNQGEVVPHAYNRDDMYGTVYQQMLPVQVVNYTPPVALMILIDSSGSMGSGDNSNLDMAIKGAHACLDALTSTDFCGVATFQDHYDEELEVTPVSKRKEIEESIENLSNISAGGTVYAAALEGAGRALSAVDVERRHIILVSDGQPSDTDKYEAFIKLNAEAGITMSIVCLGGTEDIFAKMQQDAALGGGKAYNVMNTDNLASTMKDDLITEAIGEIAYGEEFSLTIGDYSSVVAGIKQKDIPKLTGYYGTRLKSGASAPLMGKYVPLYAQWDYGTGKVGSFMCDLNGNWSEAFIDSAVGQQIVCNIVETLFPTMQIASQEIQYRFYEDNYTSQLTVYTEMAETDTLSVSVTPISSEALAFYQEKPIVVQAADGYTRFSFDVTCPGIYEVVIQKKDVSGEVISEVSTYRTLAYSAEYDEFPDEETTGEVYLREIAEDGRGIFVEDPYQVFNSFSKTLKREYDPRLLFAIISIVLMLLDIAVRKFKFKWPHEIVRDRKLRKEYAK
ncbi:MAG: VWA domain-containing protein [Clostridia bacterium]|nr:VWA domain-containing protein [Clostridia bacterium]